MKTTTITPNQLANYELAPEIFGFGLCGYTSEQGGYVYANEGYGNSERYISMEDMLDLLDYDGMITTDTVEVVVNDNNQITYVYLDVWPM